MNRRSFITATGAAGVSSLALTDSYAAETAGNRHYLELRKYTFETEAQRQGFDAFMKDAALPAFGRLGIRPVGVFQDPKGPSPVYVLLPHATLEGATSLNHRLLQDASFKTAGAAFLGAAKSNPPFQVEESWLLMAFRGMPTVETPVQSKERVFQLRTYESPSLQTGQKKIEMFNDAGELKIFREVGLAPVFFGETLFGAKMPNLTYMLAFKNPEELKAAWGRFGQHPEWKKLRAMAEYADGTILRGITNTELRPTEYSQI